MKKKAFLALALSGLVALSFYIGKQVENEKKIVHSKEICPFADTLYNLGLQDAAYQHITNRINATEEDSIAIYKEDGYMDIVGQVQWPHEIPGSFSVSTNSAFNNNGVNFQFENYGDEVELAISYPDKHIELYKENEALKTLRIRR